LPDISRGGRVVAGVLIGGVVVATTTHGVVEVFVRDIKTGTTTLVSVNSGGTGGGDDCSRFPPAISADGRFVAFESEASDLVTDDTNFNADVFVRDLKAGKTTMASVNIAGTNGGNDNSGGFRVPVMSIDGRFVAFESDASDLVANDTNGLGSRNPVSDVYVRDLNTGTTTLVSVNSAGTAS